jgi:hypothetical protein
MNNTNKGHALYSNLCSFYKLVKASIFNIISVEIKNSASVTAQMTIDFII